MTEKLATADFAGWQHTEIQGTTVDTDGLPFSDEFLAEAFPAEVNPDTIGDFVSSSWPLTRTSPAHARSYELELGKHTETDRFVCSAVWADRYGNRYTALNLKGNNFSNQTTLHTSTAANGYIAFGLQESIVMGRVLKVSEQLRQAGIDTEWLVRFIEPKTLPFGADQVSQAEYRSRLVHRILAETSDPLEAAQTAEAISEMTFFTTVRAMKVPDRLIDFLEDKDKTAAVERLARVFAVHNATAESGQRRLHVEQPEDIKYYLEELLPNLLARNLGRLHNLGLMHTFPYLGNVHALGGLVDLDSVKGEPLGFGDRVITPEDCMHDINYLFFGEDNSFGLMKLVKDLEHKGLINEAWASFDTMDAAFWSAYLTERNLSNMTADNATERLRLSIPPKFDRQLGSAAEVMKLSLAEHLGELQPNLLELFCLDELCAEVIEKGTEELPDTLRWKYDMTFNDRLKNRSADESVEEMIDELLGIVIAFCLNYFSDLGYDRLQKLMDDPDRARLPLDTWLETNFPETIRQPVGRALATLAAEALELQVVESPSLQASIQQKLEDYSGRLEAKAYKIDLPKELVTLVNGEVVTHQLHDGRIISVVTRAPLEALGNAIAWAMDPDNQVNYTLHYFSAEERFSIDDMAVKTGSGMPRVLMTDGSSTLRAYIDTPQLDWRIANGDRRYSNYLAYFTDPNESGRRDLTVVIFDENINVSVTDPNTKRQWLSFMKSLAKTFIAGIDGNEPR